MLEDQPESEGMLDSGEMEVRTWEKWFLAMLGLEEEEAQLQCWTAQGTQELEALAA